jgi:hypothetical protein
MATETTGMTMETFAKGLFELDGATEFKNIMVFGGPGSGKTVLAGTVPGRLLFLAGEPGYISAARLGAKGQARLIPDTATAVAAAAWLEDGNASKFDWIVADGVGTMQNKFLLNYAAEAYDANPAKRAGRNLPDKPDYFNAQNFLKSWVARLIDLPVNVLFTAHAMFPEDKGTGEQLVYPSIQGKGYEIASYICGLMHAVGYMSPRINAEGEPVRRVLWQAVRDPNTETTFFAKDQFNALGVYTDVKMGSYMMPEIIARIDSGEQNEIPGVPVAPVVETAKKAGTAPRRRAARR